MKTKLVDVENVALILNWNDAESTIQCVDSVKLNSKVDLVVIVDNASTDGSQKVFTDYYHHNKDVHILINDKNSGYGGGNNFGIQYILDNFSFFTIWILNNDSFICNDALSPMLNILKANEKSIVGSVIINSNNQLIECYGGGFNYPILGKAKLYLKNKPISYLINYSALLPDYIMGCSLLIPKSMIEEVGLMDETYFMYSEEIDWETRASAYGYSLAVADKSYVYHRGSGSSGGRSANFHYYRNRGAMIYNRKFHSFIFTLTSAFLLSGITLIQEFRNRNNLVAGIKGIFDGIRIKSDKQQNG
jgi:GT2 family glycosyltransferase